MTDLTILTESRVNHSRTVSYLMGVLAPIVNIDSHEAALCGWLHDFAYCITDNEHHAAVGGELLKEQGYIHWTEIANHGSIKGLDTPLGVLLNIADMTVDSNGKIVGFDKRLNDVASRYGQDSIQYSECKNVIDAIMQTTIYDKLKSTIQELITH